MKRWVRWTVVGGVLAATAAGARQGSDPFPDVGIAPQGQTAMEFVGQEQVDSNSVRRFGYFTRIAGLKADDVFFPGLQEGPQDARFTYFCENSVMSRQQEVGPVSTFANESGLFTLISVYMRPAAGAAFDDPNSFKAGMLIGRFRMTYHETLNSPDGAPGSATERGAWKWDAYTTAPVFTVNGKRYQLGRKDILWELNASGSATVRERLPSIKADVSIAGTLEVLPR